MGNLFGKFDAFKNWSSIHPSIQANLNLTPPPPPLDTLRTTRCSRRRALELHSLSSSSVWTVDTSDCLVIQLNSEESLWVGVCASTWCAIAVSVVLLHLLHIKFNVCAFIDHSGSYSSSSPHRSPFAGAAAVVWEANITLK